MARRRTGSLEVRGGVFHARVTVDLAEGPKRVWYSLQTSERATAKRKLKRLLMDLYGPNGTAALQTPAPRTVGQETVACYAEGFFETLDARGVVSAQDDRSNFKNWIAPYIGGLALADVKAGHIREIIEATVAARLSRESVKKVRALANRIFDRAWKHELIAENPVARTELPKIREKKKARAILTDAEIAAFLGHESVDVEIKLATLVARTIGGMRLGDVIRWDWSHMDLETFGACTVPRSKTGSPQTLEVPESVRGVLRARWEAVGCPEAGPIFPVERGPRKGQFRPKRGVSFARRLRRELLKAGITRRELHEPTESTLPVDFHSARRGYSTALARAGVNAQRALKLANHSDSRTHQKYVMDVPEMRRAPEEAIPYFDPAAIAPKGFAIGMGRTNLRKSGTALQKRDSEPLTSAALGR